MKQILFILVSLCTLSAFGQWNSVYLSSQQPNAMSVINQDTVILSTQNIGYIYRSDAGGAAMTPYQTLFTTEWFTDIDFPSSNVGYACGGAYFGTPNVIVKTLDNGVTWDSLSFGNPPGYVYSNIEFINNDTGFVSGDSGNMLKTTDGGITFIPLSLPANVNTTEVYVTNTSRILVSLTQPLSSATNSYIYAMYASDDLGSSWNIKYSDTVHNVTVLNTRVINDIYFINANIGYAVGGSGLFLKTIDGGDTWLRSFISPFSNLTTVFFTSNDIGYTNIAGGISKTIDGGNSWSQQNVVFPSSITQITFVNEYIGYAIGANGLYRTDNSGGTLNSIQEANLNTLVSTYPNPVNDILYLSIPEEMNIHEIVLFDIYGKIIKKFPSNQTELQVQGIPSGQYFIQIISDRENITKKVTIN